MPNNGQVETTPEPATNAQSLADAILARRDTRTAQGRRTSPQDHPRASSVGPCAREVYHQVADWQLRPSPDVPLLQRFERGNQVENIVVRELLADGFEVHHFLAQQIAFEIREHCPIETLGKWTDTWKGRPVYWAKFEDIIICRGHMDGRIAWNGDNPVFEVKSLNPNVWGRINDFRDFFSMGGFWTKYPRQMLLYLYQAAEPYGLFILDDCLGHWKILTVLFDDYLDECEEALRTCREAAIAARTGTPPPFYSDPTECLDCWCYKVGVCSPPLDFTPQKFIELHADDISLAIGGAEAHREEHAIFQSCDKKVKDTMKLYGPGTYLAGDYVITCEQKSNGFFVKWKHAGQEEGDDKG